LVECFFLILPSDLESVLNSAFLGTHIDLFEEKSFQLYFKKNIMQSIPVLLYSMVFLGGGDAVHTCIEMLGRRVGHEFSSKMPRTMSNLPDFPRRPFLYVHLLYTKSMYWPKKVSTLSVCSMYVAVFTGNKFQN